MATKSAHNTLDTCKEILQVIKILCNIQNTMSDRAVTELNFDEVLERYREELLPQIRADYNTMNDENSQYT